MKIVVVNGTSKHGVSYRLKEIFLDEFRNGGDADITEFYLPADCPGFCAGCLTCFGEDEKRCKDAEYVGKIEKAMLEADLLVFVSPAYVFHATGAMKSMLDHFGYRWMPHRPAKEMFGKRALIITQCLGSGDRPAAKDIRDSLSWWGISYIRECRFKLLSDVVWDKIPAKKRAAFTRKLIVAAEKFRQIDYSRPASVKAVTRLRFYAARLLQKNLGRKDPEYTDYKYWEERGWTKAARPWKPE